ncbi:MAG TPA: AAA family ATPase [Gemmatimonadaceae bacterium]|nr:AAA family ATPase [Gemmatimonadaceae bacterium]
MPHFYRSPDEFTAAAQAAVAGAAPRAPVAVLVAEVDPPEPPDAAGALRSTQSAVGAVAEIVRHTLRGDDHVGVFEGGLVMVLVGATADDGRSVGERLCAAVRIHAFGDGLGPLTLSIGAAAAPENGASYEALLSASRQALTRIQSQGRDGASAAPLPHHEALHRPLSIDRFAGRVQELAALTGWLDEACSGQPRVVTVFGETGTGTAMLLRQLESEVRLRGGVFVMAASPQSESPLPYAVWSSLLKATSRFATPAEREWKELQHLERSFGEVGAAAAVGSQYRLLGELADYVRLLAASRPLVLVLDEMQWADSTSWDALEHLLGLLDTDRIMLCMAQRPDSVYDTSQHREMLKRHEITRELTLSRLTREEVKQWLEAAFHRQPVAREFLAFLYRHSEGNPLFISQLLRALVEDGAVWHNGTRWEWRPVSELRLPQGRAALIGARLARFSSSTQAVLATAAIIGREFDIGLLVGAGAGSEAAVKLAISEALLSGLLRPTYERKRGGFVFAHDEIAEVLVESISRDRIRGLHERVAEALVKQRPERAGEIAMHFDAAGKSTDAYSWAQEAARNVERVYAQAAAGAYLQIAARNASTPAELAEIRIALAHLAEAGGRFDEVEELCDLAIEWLQSQSDERRALTLRRMRERARMEQGQPARATLDALVVLDAEAQRLTFDRERVALLMMQSQAYGRLGDQRTAVRIASDCVEMARHLGDRATLGDALTRLGLAHVAETPGEAREAFADALALFEAVGDVRGQARSFNHLGISALFEARLDEAQQAFSRAITVARSAGIPDLWGLAAQNLGVLCQKCGDYDRARELLGDALALFAGVKHSEFQLIALYNMAHIERELGLWESAAELYDATIPLAQRIGQSDIEIGAMAGAGLCHLEVGRGGEAREAYSEVHARLQSRPDWFQGRELAEALIVKLDALDGRTQEAISRFDRALVLAETADLYNAAWLTVTCADALRAIAPDQVKVSIERYRERVKALGYPEMTKRYEALAVP